MTKSFYKCDPFNFVPFTRTPWAGKQIAKIKQSTFENQIENIPEFIGESWEVSTDSQFPSKVETSPGRWENISSLLNTNADEILGHKITKKHGAHFPLLLKWLEANQNLSVQIHPSHDHPLLKEKECGKPEAWLVLNVEQNGFVYLGFKENLSKDQIIQYLRNDESEKCLHVYHPKKYDYISVPTGCIHAVGPHVLLAEPQYVLPNKSGKTWRISDWKRLYDANGHLSQTGKPRELHLEAALTAIDWNLPRGKELEKYLIRPYDPNLTNVENPSNPFPLQIFSTAGTHVFNSLIPNTFSLFTVWEGSVTLLTNNETLELKAGESGFISASHSPIKVLIQNNGIIGFFSLKDA
jgi:mannose-6-phosphate isomerase